MFIKNVLFNVFFIIFGQFAQFTHLTFHDSAHGFITKNSQYFDDELSHIHEGIGDLRNFQSVDSLAGLNLRLDPKTLDFGERSLGSIHSITVTLYNTDSNKSVDLTSISGNTVHFHSSFFEDKQIPPNGNTTFKVVYLGRQEGPVESTLFLQTSHGFIKYQVKAYGTFNSYRLRPIVGVKLPVNSLFNPAIYMHNPHSKPIQIVEIYSSGGGFHLELPGGELEGSNDLWEVKPQETKAVIRVRFESKTPQNHTAYIRIKLHHPEEILIVPLEVEVISADSIFYPQGVLDFGFGGSLSEPRQVDLCLLNPSSTPVRVHSVSTPSKSIKTHYYNIKIDPVVGDQSKLKCVSVGTLTLDWKNAWKNQDFHGKIVVKFHNGKNRTEIPYFLTVIKGGLTYNLLSTSYFLNQRDMDNEERMFKVINEFPVPVRVMDILFPHDMEDTFKVRPFCPLTIQPREKKTLFNISLKVEKTDMQLSSVITVLTNITDIQVPLLSYNGKVHVHLPFASKNNSFDVGLLGHDKQIKLFYVVTNPNPVSLPLLKVWCSVPSTDMQIYSCGAGDHRKIQQYNSFGNFSQCDKILPHGYAVIRTVIKTGTQEGPVTGTVEIKTLFETLNLPYSYTVAVGELLIERDDLAFEDCFPGKICSHQLRIFSSFSDKMLLEGIVPIPADKRVSAKIVSHIFPNDKRVVAHVYFYADLDCGQECYTGFVKEGSASWLQTLSSKEQMFDYDVKLVNIFYRRYKNASSDIYRNVTFRLDTNGVKGFNFLSRIVYKWPSLLKGKVAENSTLMCPVTLVHNSSKCTLILHNPASYNVVVQLMLNSHYPGAKRLCSELPTAQFIPGGCEDLAKHKLFSFNKKVLREQQKYFSEKLQINVYNESVPFLMLPGESRNFTIDFKAEKTGYHFGLLIIRNNLTILEAVRLQGRAGQPQFAFRALRPGGSKAFHFNLSEPYLKSCYLDNPKPSLPNLTIVHTFVAKNEGEIELTVREFFINGSRCEGFGFKVLNCESFVLPGNSTRIIKVAFTADLTLYEERLILSIATSLKSYVNYSLLATVSRNYCRHCCMLLPRPPWEVYISYLMAILIGIMLFVLMCVAMLDSRDVNAKAFEIYLASSHPPLMPVLDLRKIGHQVKEEIQQTPVKETPVVSPEKTSQRETADRETMTTNEEVPVPPVKSEPAIIPTTGRAKKRLSQKYNLDTEYSVDEENEREQRVRERQKKKDILFERHRIKSRERKTEKELKLLEEKGRKEKHAQQRDRDQQRAKKQGRVDALATVTSAESNSAIICDELDRENNQRNGSTKPSVTFQCGGSSTASSSPRDAQDYKIKHVSFVNSKLKNKNGSKSSMEQEKELEIVGTERNDEFSKYACTRDKRRKESKFKERKDKLIYRHKSFAERKLEEANYEKDVPKGPASFYVPLPIVTTTCTTWCESKARFSEVVARTDQLPDTSVVSPSTVTTAVATSAPSLTNHASSLAENCSRLSPAALPFSTRSPFKGPKNGGRGASSKPTMFVEPYKPIDLGPIGSKRLGTPDSNSPDFFSTPSERSQNGFSPINDQNMITAINNSLLSNDSFFSPPPPPQHERLSNSAVLEAWPGDVLYNPEPIRSANLFRNQETEDVTWRGVQDGATASNVGTDSTSSDYWSNTFSSVLDSNSKLRSNAPYLWSSNYIWKPWSTSDGSTANPVRKTPPGFEESSPIRRRKLTADDERNNHAHLSNGPYNSFGTNGDGRQGGSGGSAGGSIWGSNWQ